MVSTLGLFVKVAPRSVQELRQLGLTTLWDERMELKFQGQAGAAVTITDICSGVEGLLEQWYQQHATNPDRLIVQVYSLHSTRNPGDDLARDLKAPAAPSLTNGDTIVVETQAMKQSQLEPMPEWTEEDLNAVRENLRFGLNDRVLCYCGPRWLSGLIVGTAAPDDEGILPYLVKTDPLPGMPQRTISVPNDRDYCCMQERCFEPDSELHLVKAAAAVVPESKRPKLRFAVGAAVVCRVRNAEDGLERWVPGKVSLHWPKLPGEQKWEMGEASGSYPDAVPYRVELNDGGWTYCHKDNHTLIRRKGLEPQERVKGISKRIEVRTASDGAKERFDHVTERGKRLATEPAEDDSE
eukprot:TRINITY_DN2613_c0_g3_i1.p1 TRINITY_DN2613_c0_g3~~TRINITY_DN2613_c0_g3_i1.p1  ORF type:complete len:353 (-),score=56.60 TRINITY_DN2613_c0_g3_i1:99-1157(-)